jgi:hypothetical protein
VITHQVKEGFRANKIPGAVNRMPITQGLLLRDEAQSSAVTAHRVERVGVRLFIAWRDDDGNLFYARAQHFLYQDAQHGLVCPVAVNQHLEWQRALVTTCCRDDSLSDIHG